VTLFITFVQQAVILLVIVYTVLTFVMSPYHPVRTALARIIEPHPWAAWTSARWY